MSQAYVIMNVTVNPSEYLTNDNIFVTDVTKAKQFTTLQAGRNGKSKMHEELKIWGDEQANYAVIPYTGAQKKPVVKSLPHPDFFEVMNPHSAEGILNILSDPHFEMCFTAVNVMTGSGQMKFDLYYDAETERPLGRAYEFSFPGYLTVDEVDLLKEMASEHWTACAVYAKGKTWFVVKLMAAIK